MSSIFIFRKNYIAITKEVPATGGIYTEGILQSSASGLSDSIASLTHLGLTRLGPDGTIQPAVAKSWTISPDGKIYTFILNDQYSSSELIDYFRVQKGKWSDIQITSPDEHTLQFTLKQSFGLFLASTFRPILPFGPYKISKQTSLQITLVPNTVKPLSKPYISKVIFQIFSTQQELSQALKSGKVTATDEQIDSDSLRCCQKYSTSMPRYNVAFLNTEHLPDIAIRKQILNGPSFAEPKKLNLLRANTDPAAKFTDELIKDFATRNIQITQKIISPIDLIAEATKKQYDILVYGFNTGYYDDPYLYWHSTQIPPKGNNFSLYKNKAADRLIEEGRTTLDEKIRREKFVQAKTLVKDEAVAIFQNNQSYTFYANKSVKGIDIKYLTTAPSRFTFIDKWYIKTKRVHK